MLSFVTWAQQAPSKASDERAVDDVAFDRTEIPDAPTPQNTANADSSKKAGQEGSQNSQEQPKRILGLMPNYRAVSAGEIPPVPTPKQAFRIATLNSFDYSSYLVVGVTSLLAEGTDAHPDLGKGAAGYWRYYWRGFVDKTDGNYLVLFVLPTVLHEDERFYAKGEGSIWKRAIYASTRVLITPDYHGHNTFNASEILGRGIAQGISMSYYPSNDRRIGEVGERYAFSLGRDALANVFREFWPDISHRIHHRHP